MNRLAGRIIMIYIGLFLLSTITFAVQPVNSPPGQWVTERSGEITVQFEEGDRQNAKALLELYEERLPDIAIKLGVDIPNGIRVVIAPTKARFRYLTRGLPEWTGGVAYPRQKAIVLLAPRLYQEHGQFAVTALHEVIHVLTDHDGPSHLPRWLSEGLAMYLSGETMYKKRTPLGRAVVFGKTFTLEDIQNMLRLGPDQARVAYLQSINFVEFLVEHYGWGAVATLIEGYRTGRDEDEMFIGITGRDLFDVEAAWHRELRHAYRWYAVLNWLNFDTILWSSATVLVIIAGGLAIYRRRTYLKDNGDDEAPPVDGGESQDPITGEWYVDDDYWQ